MKYIKKTLAPVICVLILASMCCVSAFAAVDNDSLVPMHASSAKVSYYEIKISNSVYKVPTTTIVGYNHTTTGTYVTTAQKALNNVNGNYYEANCSCGKPDSIFGPDTWQAAYNFQDWVGLEPDGIIGPDTWSALEIYCA